MDSVYGKEDEGERMITPLWVRLVQIPLPPEGNFHIAFGELSGYMIVKLHVSKTWENRLKWWLFCQFFPGQIIKWEKE